MNRSYRSSDSAPRKASVPGLALAWPPLEVPATGSSLPGGSMNPHQQLTPRPPSASSDKQGREGLVAPRGTPPSMWVMGKPQLLSGKWVPPSRKTRWLPGPSQPFPTLRLSVPSMRKEHRLPARRTHPHPSCQLPFSKRNSSLQNKIFCPKHCRRRGEKNPASLVLSHSTSFFQKPQALGGLDMDSATQLATRLGTDSVSELPKLRPVLKSCQDPG